VALPVTGNKLLNTDRLSHMVRLGTPYTRSCNIREIQTTTRHANISAEYRWSLSRRITIQVCREIAFPAVFGQPAQSVFDLPKLCHRCCQL